MRVRVPPSISLIDVSFNLLYLSEASVSFWR
nr:MAG TPA: hypothetical protein [Caudoviricetes sp.]